MDPATPLAVWLLLGLLYPLILLVLPTYVGSTFFRLAVSTSNACCEPNARLPLPSRATAMSVIFLATLFNVLVTWSYHESFRDDSLDRSTPSQWSEEEQQDYDDDRSTEKTPTQVRIDKAILLIRVFLFAGSILILTRILLPTTPWRAFLITGNYWLINYATLAFLAVLLRIELFLPAPR